MNGSASSNGSSKTMTSRQAFKLAGLFYFLLLLAATASFYLPSQAGVIWSADQLKLKAGDQAEYSNPTFDDHDWTTTDVGDVRAMQGVGWIRVAVDIPAGSNPIPPYALFLSGLFSAEVYWDGQSMGNKGQVGATSDTEVAGPIDSVLYIPESLSALGRHHLAIRISSGHLGYQPQNLIHRLTVGGFQSDPRRQLRYYALPMILSGGFLLLVLQFSRMFHVTGSRSALVLAFMALFVLLQLASEVSRSIVAYPYEWHLVRSAVIWLFAAGTVLSLNFLAAFRTGHRWSRLWIGLASVLALAASFMVSGFDNKTVMMINILASAFVVLSFWGMQRENPDLTLLATSGLGITWLVTGRISEYVLLDSTFYLTSITYLSMVWFWISLGRETVERTQVSTDGVASIYVKHTGRTEKVPVVSVLYLKACGNYTEIVCVDGRTVLHHQRLGQIMEKPPEQFLRVHRSHAVNLAFVHGLCSYEGSRYFAQLQGGSEIPVSRYQAREVRAFLQK